MENPWRLEFGARPAPSGGAQFRVWSPLSKEMSVKIKAPREILVPMDYSDGIFTTSIKEIGPGADYVYVIDGKKERPDPVSRFQPSGVHGPSRIIDPDAFKWSDGGWKGIALEDYVIYELHIGTFTSEGTFASAIEKLSYLRDAGITAVEIMPVAQFPEVAPPTVTVTASYPGANAQIVADTVATPIEQEINGGALHLGSPETVARRIAMTIKDLGAVRFDMKYSVGTLPHDKLMRCIELYGTKVKPLVREMIA